VFDGDLYEAALGVVVVFAAVMGLADVLLTAWWARSGWGMAMSGVAIAGLIVFVAWSLRPPP
jgi:hypothetical protein